MKFTLYHYWRSSSSWRVRWALNLKQLPCAFVEVNLLDDSVNSPENLKRNPMGYIPTLEIREHVAGSIFLSESIAMIEWLEEQFPEPIRLLPTGALDRAHVRHLAEIINSGTQPLQNPMVTDRHTDDPAEKIRWNQTWIRKGLGAFEAVARPRAGVFSFGDQVTLADLCLIPQCYNALRFEIDLASEYPLLSRIYEAARRTPECQAASPEAHQPAQ